MATTYTSDDVLLADRVALSLVEPGEFGPDEFDAPPVRPQALAERGMAILAATRWWQSDRYQPGCSHTVQVPADVLAVAEIGAGYLAAHQMCRLIGLRPRA